MSAGCCRCIGLLERHWAPYKQLELTLRLPADQTIATEALGLATQLQELHAQSIDALTHWLEQHSEPSLVAGQGEPVKLDRLLRALRDADPVAAEVCLHSPVEDVPDDLLQTVREAVTDFDFKRAIALLATNDLIKPD